MKKCVIIYNPNSGRKSIKPYLPQIESLLKYHDYEVEIIPTQYKGHATEIVSDIEKIDLLMSFGGDGTFNEVMTGNLKREKHYY